MCFLQIELETMACYYLCKLFGGMPSSGPKVRLFIEKSTIYIKQFSGGFQNGSAFTDSSDILNKTYYQLSLGGQLISIERNGKVVT